MNFFNAGATNRVGAVNNTVSTTTAISSLKYGNTNNFHTTKIALGKTLSITGVGGLTVGTETDSGSNQTVYATIIGAGGTLVLSNQAASLNVYQASATAPLNNQQERATLDMDGLDNFVATVSNIVIGVYDGSIVRPAGTIFLAKTNVITASTSTTWAEIDVGDAGASSINDSTFNYLYLGQTNAVYVDSIMVGGARSRGWMGFNPAFINATPTVWLRGTNGSSSRVSTWGVGDAGAIVQQTGSQTLGTNDFTGGIVDALVDTMILGRGENVIGPTATGDSIGLVAFDQGTINVNTLEVGYQMLPSTNAGPTYTGFINVLGSNATLVVNNNLLLAYTQGGTNISEGTLNVANGSVQANTITAGGGTSTIILTNGTLILTNTAGTPASGLSTLSITDSTLQLTVSSTITNIVATNLITGGTNEINIASLPAIGATPAQFKLIDYTGSIGGSGFNFGAGTLPVGISGYISNNVSQSSVDLVVTSVAPTQLAITSVNGGSSPTAGTSFSVIVQSQDANGTARPVAANTSIALSLNTGSGMLGGTLSGTINAGSSSVTISGVTYTTAESGVSLTATRTSGDNLAAANSSTFAVNSGVVSAAQSTVTASPSAVVADGASTSTITVTLTDANGNPISGKTVTLAKNGGSSAISAASGASDANGNVTFTVTDTVAESSTYSATDVTDGIGITQTAAITFVAHSATTFLWTNGVAGNWSTNWSWSPNGKPDLFDTVDFFDAGSTNNIGAVNNTVDTNFTIQSLYYSNTNNFHTTRIVAGAMLTVMSNFTIGTETYVTPSQTVNATITGQGVFSLNLSAHPTVLTTIRQGVASGTLTSGTPQATLDMSGLDTFNMIGNGIVVGVESSGVRRASGTLYLAKTNTILVTRSGYDANFAGGNPGIYIGHNTQAGNVSPQGSAIYLGITNAIYANYIIVGRGNQTNNLMAFNPSFLSFNPTAYIRGTNYTDRVGLWTIGDNSAGSQTSPSSGTNDFTGGKVDALVNYMFVGRGRVEGANSNIGVGTLTFNAGTIDVHNLNVGYQTTNVFAVGVGTVNVNGGTLTVNTNLLLANVTSGSDPGAAAAVAGTLNIRGGTVNANNISDGGGTATITMTNGTLVVTNTLGTPAQPLNFFAITNSTLQFSVVANSTNAAVVALATGGTNIINIASLPNISSYPTQFTLIDYSGTISGAGFNFGLGSLSGYAGYISNRTANSTITLVVTAATSTKLAITSVNGGASPTAGTGFSVVVQAQDNSGTPQNVVSNTAVTLSLNTGSGTLGGTLTGTIAAGTSSVTISGVTYTKAESGVVLTATATSGDALAAANSSSFTVKPGAFVKLQLLLPGETAAPGTASGKTGTPTAETAGTAFNIIVNAVDANWNLISTNDTVSISWDGSAQASSALVAGTKTVSANPKIAGNVTISVSDTTHPGISGSTSPTFTLNPGAFAKLQLLMPGETASPGSVSGKTGTPGAQTVGTPFNVTVNAVDANWNFISTNDTVAITSSDGSATLPGNAALAAGAQTFSMTLNTAGTTTTVTASDTTHAGIANNTSPAITVNKGNQTITFPSPGNQTYGVAPLTLGATASSGLTVSYSVTSGPATVAGNSLTITGTGSVTIQASQAGNANWNAATSTNQTISVAQKTVTISSGLTANNKTYDGTTAATVSSNNVALSGVVASDVSNVKLSTNGYSATFASANVGNGISVSIGGLALTGSVATNYMLTQPTLSANITAASTLNAIVSSLNPALPGSNVTFTATISVVSPGAGTPTGNVVFKNGTTPLSTNVLNGSAIATFSSTTLSHGSHTITAEFAGGGNFFGSTNNLSPNQIINTPPVAGNDTIARYSTSSAKVRLSMLLTNDSDADGDTVITTVCSTNANGAMIAISGGWVFYTPPAGFTNADSFTYTNADGLGGNVVSTVSVTILPDTTASQNIGSIDNLGNGSSLIHFSEIPGRTYTVQYTTNLVTPNWQSLGPAAADAFGKIDFTDSFATNSPARFYRSAYP